MLVHRADGHVGLTQPMARHVLIEIGFLRPQVGVFVGMAVDPGTGFFQAHQEIGDGFALAVDGRCRGGDGAEARHQVFSSENRARAGKQNLLGNIRFPHRERVDAALRQCG
ncbi:hypothetical protein D3C85_1466440 [compost metagenome]